MVVSPRVIFNVVFSYEIILRIQFFLQLLLLLPPCVPTDIEQKPCLNQFKSITIYHCNGSHIIKKNANISKHLWLIKNGTAKKFALFVALSPYTVKLICKVLLKWNERIYSNKYFVQYHMFIFISKTLYKRFIFIAVVSKVQNMSLFCF